MGPLNGPELASQFSGLAQEEKLRPPELWRICSWPLSQDSSAGSWRLQAFLKHLPCHSQYHPSSSRHLFLCVAKSHSACLFCLFIQLAVSGLGCIMPDLSLWHPDSLVRAHGLKDQDEVFQSQFSISWSYGLRVTSLQTRQQYYKSQLGVGRLDTTVHINFSVSGPQFLYLQE